MVGDLGTTASYKLLAYGMGMSIDVTLWIGPISQSKALVSLMVAIIYAPIPENGNPSSTVTNLPVFLTLWTMVSLSNGLMVLRLMT